MTDKKPSSPFANAELCTHCGYCLPVCPSYRAFNNELHSPRGRVSLLLAVREGRLPLTRARESLDHCLLCRACHLACPAGVKPARLVLAARQREPLAPTTQGGLFHRLTSNPLLTAAAARLLGLERRLPRLLPPAMLPAPLAHPLALFPTATGLPFPPAPPPPPPGGPRVGLLSGCMARLFFPRAAEAAKHLLAALGWVALSPREFGCCGAPFREQGDQASFLRQARLTLDAFSRMGGLTAIVCDSGVCATTFASYGKALAKDPEYAELAGLFSRKVKPLSQFLLEAGAPAKLGLKAGFGPVTHHDHCQLRNGLGIIDAPRALLAATGAWVELPRADRCCGAGGEYMLRHPETSRLIRADKLAAIGESKAVWVTAENPGCLMNLHQGLVRERIPARVCHLAEFLWAATTVTRRP